MKRDRPQIFALLLVLVAVVLAAGCDTVEPEGGPVLVVEGYLDAGKPLPRLVLRHTLPLSEVPRYEMAAVSDASVTLMLDGHEIPYHAIDGRPGHYEPAVGAGVATVPPRALFELAAMWEGQQVSASGRVPPAITIDGVEVVVPEAPVEAVLLDSLFSFDVPGGEVRTGYIYPIEVTVFWKMDFAETDADSLYWVRTQLRPQAAFAVGASDFFLRPEQIIREGTLPLGADGRRRWTGVYAVPVADAASPLPEHRLRVSLLRSFPDYARFASSMDAPERREPISNVEGGLGIVAGVSIDSLSLPVAR